MLAHLKTSCVKPMAGVRLWLHRFVHHWREWPYHTSNLVFVSQILHIAPLRDGASYSVSDELHSNSSGVGELSRLPQYRHRRNRGGIQPEAAEVLEPVDPAPVDLPLPWKTQEEAAKALSPIPVEARPVHQRQKRQRQGRASLPQDVSRKQQPTISSDVVTTTCCAGIPGRLVGSWPNVTLVMR